MILRKRLTVEHNQIFHAKLIESTSFYLAPLKEQQRIVDQIRSFIF